MYVHTYLNDALRESTIFPTDSTYDLRTKELANTKMHFRVYYVHNKKFDIQGTTLEMIIYQVLEIL